MQKIKIRKGEKAKPKGEYKIIEIDMRTEEAKELEKKGRIKELLAKFTLKKYEFTNIVPDTGLEALAENLINGTIEDEYKIRISYIAVGTGTSTPVAGNTQLEAEVFRDTVDDQFREGKVARSDILIKSSEANGYTLAEVGAFCGDATSSTNSGRLFSHALFSTPITKTSTKAIFIEISHTFSDA